MGLCIAFSVCRDGDWYLRTWIKICRAQCSGDLGGGDDRASQAYVNHRDLKGFTCLARPKMPSTPDEVVDVFRPRRTADEKCGVGYHNFKIHRPEPPVRGKWSAGHTRAAHCPPLLGGRDASHGGVTGQCNLASRPGSAKRILPAEWTPRWDVILEHPLSGMAPTSI